MRAAVRTIQRIHLRASVAVIVVAVVTFALIAFFASEQRKYLSTESVVDDMQRNLIEVSFVHRGIVLSGTTTDGDRETLRRVGEQIDENLAAIRERTGEPQSFDLLEGAFDSYASSIEALIVVAEAGNLPEAEGMSPEKAAAAAAMVNTADQLSNARSWLQGKATDAWNRARFGFAGAVLFLVVAVLTITRVSERRLARIIVDRERLRIDNERSRQFTTLMENMTDTVFVLDEDGHVRYCSPGIERAFGWSPHQIMAAKLADFVHPDDYPEARQTIHSWLDDGLPRTSVTIVVRARTGDAGWASVECVVSDGRDVPGIVGIVINVRDITARRQAEEQLHFLALHDSLTGLANRRALTGFIEKALQPDRRARSPFGVMFIDLDDFKQVNDRWGHVVGDKLLNEVANRLRSVLREGDKAARPGGDEFVLLVYGLSNLPHARAIADRIHDVLSRPFMIDGVECRISASIGIFIPDTRTTTTVDDVLRHADTAMYRSKNEGQSLTTITTTLGLFSETTLLERKSA